MRIAAILFILVSLGINFVYNNFSTLMLAMFSFPVLVVLLLRKKKRKSDHRKIPQTNQPEKTDSPTVKE